MKLITVTCYQVQLHFQVHGFKGQGHKQHSLLQQRQTDQRFAGEDHLHVVKNL